MSAAPPTTDPSDDPALADQLRSATLRDELLLRYLPEYDLLTGRVIAAEALVRWAHPTRGILEPDEFVPFAERAGLMTQLGEWVIRTAVATLAGWQVARTNPRFCLRVNVSAGQLVDGDFVTLLRDVLAEHGVPGSMVCLELTEREPARDLSEIADLLRRLRELGVVIAIDDLATGYSTLSRLRALPVDVIKLDRSLVTGIDRDERAQAIVTALMGLALNFDLDVIAEGVQNEHEVAALLTLGCTHAQGHFLSPPLAPNDLRRLISGEFRVSGE